MSHDYEHAEKRWYLVNYDIRDQRRWRSAYKILKGSGERIQYSLFRCRLSKTEMDAASGAMYDLKPPCSVAVCPRPKWSACAGNFSRCSTTKTT